MVCYQMVYQLTETTSRVFFVLINTLVAMTSVCGNGIVMFVIITRHRLHRPTYYLIFSLALSDFTIASIGQVSYVIEVAFKEYTSCAVDKVIACLNGMSCGTSLLLLCMISRDRWLHVAKGLRYNEYTSNKQVIVISVACWLIGLSIVLPYGFQVKSMQDLSTLGFAVNGASCFIAICIINVKVNRIVRNHLDEMQTNRQNDDQVEAFNNIRSRLRQERAKIEQSVNRSIIASVAAYSISWLPGIVLLTIITVLNLQDKQTTPELSIATTWVITLSYFNGAINPLIYAYRCDDIGRDIHAFASSFKSKVFPGLDQEPC